MKFPTKVDIGGLTYDIIYITAGKDDTKLKKDEAGAIVQAEQKIYIDKNLSSEVKLLVIVHEILHGCGDTMRPNGGPFVKEDFTHIMANLLLQALKSMNILKP